MNEHEPFNPELPPNGPASEDDPVPSEPSETTPGDDLDLALLSDALDQMRRYVEAAGGFGEAFLAYLDLDVPTPPPGGETQDFLERYLGFYPDRETFVRERLKNLGWTAALQNVMREEGMWPDDIRWNGFALWEHFSRTYGLVERFGGVHAFRR